MSEIVVLGSTGNAAWCICNARQDSGLFVGLPSVVRLPGSSSAIAANESTISAIHVPSTRHGCWAQARAMLWVDGLVMPLADLVDADQRPECFECGAGIADLIAAVDEHRQLVATDWGARESLG